MEYIECGEEKDEREKEPESGWKECKKKTRAEGEEGEEKERKTEKKKKKKSTKNKKKRDNNSSCGFIAPPNTTLLMLKFLHDTKYIDTVTTEQR